jgi:CRISPR system Cascade subunit CasA
MGISFNLIDEPWIPCVLPDGTAEELSLRDTLARAHEIAEVAGETPPITVALHRLLLAVLHRCFGPENARVWEALWRRGSFDMAAVDAYLATWHVRFDLFHPERPFQQTASLDEAKAGSIAKLLLQADNNPTLFDHTLVDHPPAISPARAARLLLSVQSFDTGGLLTGEGRGPDSAKAGPLLQCAVSLFRGDSLFQTLLLNLHAYNPENGYPWSFNRAADRPAWERADETRAGERRPDGYLDLLTWQSRRVRLLPEPDADGQPVVRRVVVMKGYQFPDGYVRKDAETMVAFRANRRAKPRMDPPENSPPKNRAPDFRANRRAKPRMDPWPQVGFQEERALWRDSLAFLQATDVDHARPKMADWLAELTESGAIGRTRSLRLDLLGLAADRAKLLFWRHERLTIQPRYLENSDEGKDLRTRVGQALDLAERVGRLLSRAYVDIEREGKTFPVPSPVRVLAKELLGSDEGVENIVAALGPERGYWSRLDLPFVELLRDLPEDTTKDSSDLPGAAVIERWSREVVRAAQEAFGQAVSGLEQSARGLRAIAIAERELERRLREAAAAYQTAVGGVA